MPFSVPMIWREPSNHDDCYFCLANVCGFNTKNKQGIRYPEVTSVTKPVSFKPSDPVPIPPVLKQNPEDDSNREIVDSDRDDDCTEDSNNKPILFDQSGLLDYLVRDLNLSKDKSELLSSRLKDNNLLAPETTFSWYRHREKEYIEFFSEKKWISLL